jgi:alanyl-tRNA synthetase
MTERLYYQDSYLRQFDAACVLSIETSKGFEVILDQTAFYPTSGGQPHDLGLIQESPIREVYESEEGEIIHCISKPVDGEVLKCSVDWVRRFDHMQQHTGQHILSQAFVRACRLDTVGFHMGTTYASIDLNTQSIDNHQLRQAEDLANSIVYENRPVKLKIVSPQAAPALGLRKESQRVGPLRIVEIDEFDVSACGGTHVRLTSEVGEIVVRKVERVNRQTRIEFVCGRRALESHRTVLSNLDAIANKLSVGGSETAERVEKQIEEARQLRKQLQEKN